ncbi:dihydrofolate reductase [uncultured Clostridium sp.]|uniref:dihydrofolate reductase n=1 Tax=uncultured Clostridium sp. TaxID=59620 RepID=UPI0026137510|nr:dihydrofolate reductase [uncultured Clostridium sp.]
MKAIVAVDKKFGIGHKGNLLLRIPGDMKFFKENTINNVIVMGRETLESLPKQAPLKDRVNIVLTRSKDYKKDGFVVCNSVNETLEKLKEYTNKEVFIIGGEAIYKEFLPYCDELYITKIENEYIADKYFPNISNDKSWELYEESEERSHDDIKYKMTKYKNVK